MNGAFDEAAAFAMAHEISWTRNPIDEPARWGVHHDDPPPFNRLRFLTLIVIVFSLAMMQRGAVPRNRAAGGALLYARVCGGGG